MTHWQDGPRRSSPPPYPQPPGTNDLSSRTSRLEVHQWHMVQDLQRIEQESLMRGTDLRTDVNSLRDQVAAVQGHIGTARTVAGLMPSLIRYVIAAVLFALFMAGKISVEALKPFLAALGFPTG